jgi:protein O-GlcNAc transferase
LIKDRGVSSQKLELDLSKSFAENGISIDRIILINAVATHLDHLSCYNAIDIALDTTPWSSATTAFECWGMGVPLVSIYGDTMSGRMSSSIAILLAFQTS